jgi:predicted nucleic acid-binding protein
VTYLVDTNILLRFVHTGDPGHTVASGALDRLNEAGHRLVTAFQNRSEFWNVSTRPTARNGYGLSIAATDAALRIVERAFPLLPESRRSYTVWRRLVTTYSVSGVQVHDARLAAAMLAGGVTHVLTFNAGDFARFAPEGLVAVDPAGV